MIDGSMVVQSAISSFNNAALAAPDFFWMSALCLPIFIAAWIFAGQIYNRFFENGKCDACILGIAAIAIWILSRQNFGVLRENFSWAGILLTICLFLAAALLSRRYFDGGTRLSAFIKVKEKYKKWTDGAVPVIIAAAVFACALPDWKMGLVQLAAVAAGVVLGYCRHAKSRKSLDPEMPAAAAMFLTTLAMTSQPEFLRFGQMGNLTVIHILFLSAAAVLFAVYFATRFVRPNGWPRDSWHRKFKLLGRLCIGLALILFAITESELLFIAAAAGLFAYFAEAVRHMPKTALGRIRDVRRHVWYALLCLFGILTSMPLLVVLGIILHAADERKLPVDTLKALL
ncbi:MAG: hypothetical protein LBK26_01975 [Rickettsiales bacterium]|jgi:hypothetical protein|nr:hypothetical protein [Rickettsiales bacterium]